MAEVYSKEVEVYFSSATLRGIVATRHTRLTDHLTTADETFLLKNVQLSEERDRQGGINSETVVIYKHRVILVADLGSTNQPSVNEAQLVRVDRQPHRVVIGAGPFWLRGDIHLVKGADLETVGLGTSRFIPLTQATFLDRPKTEPATFIVNREQIGCLFIAPNEELRI